MQFKQAYDHLMQNKVYLSWIEKNKDFFLAHGFILLDELNKDVWQLGFYCKAKDRMITFFVGKDSITISQESEMFKKPDTVIRELAVDKVSIDLAEVLEIIEKVRQDHYKQDPEKMFLILQHGEHGQSYNVTLITKQMDIIHIKVDASAGKVLEHHSTPLMSMMRQD